MSKNFDTLWSAIEAVHGQLVQIKDGFNSSVQTLKEMQDIDKVVRATLGDRLLPLDTDPQLRSKILKLDLTDERFTMKLAHILAKSSGEERLDLLIDTINEIGELLGECRSKRDKLEERTKLCEKYIVEDGVRKENPEYNLSCRKLNEVRCTMSKLNTKLVFCVKKFYATRKQLLNRVVGLSSQFYYKLEQHEQTVGHDYMKAYGLTQVMEELVETDKKGVTKK